MKKLTLVTVFITAMTLPVLAMADDEDVTIRVMEMNEVSSDSVMQEIQLPAAVSDQAQDQAQPGHRERERIREMNQMGEQEMALEGEMEQQREIMMDQHQEQQNVQGDAPDMPGMDGMPGPGGQN